MAAARGLEKGPAMSRFGFTLSRAWLPQANPYRASLMVSQQEGVVLNAPRDYYLMLKWYYLNNGLYDQLKKALYERGVNQATISAIKNPANRVVEFYAAKLWPGTIDTDNEQNSALPLRADNEAIVEPIHQVWEWSNWNAKKQVLARWLPTYGDGFVKVRQNDRGDRVYFQLIEAQHVTDFKTDDRGYVVYMRIDTSTPNMPDGLNLVRGRTEVWRKGQVKTGGPDAGGLWDDGVYIYENSTITEDIENLGNHTDFISLAEMGIDFIPIVHIPFKDIGDVRGLGAFVHALDKIDEANTVATRLHQILYRHNKPLWAIMAGGVDALGRPLPAPVVGQNANASIPNDPTLAITFGDDDIITLPGQQHMESMVPNLNFGAHLDTLVNQLNELENDLPELTYSRIRELGANISGRAAKLMLLPASDRAIEARANAEQGLIRCNQMALTIGIAAGIFPRTLGSYEAGSFRHTFTTRPIMPPDALEEAQAQLAEAQAAAARVGLGVSPQQALRELSQGYSDEDIARFATETAQTPQGQQQALGIQRQQAALQNDQSGGPLGANDQAGQDAIATKVADALRNTAIQQNANGQIG